MNKEELINYLQERIDMHKRKYEDYKNAYVEYAKKLDNHQVENAYNFMHQEHAIVIELEIVLDVINERGIL